MAALPLTLRVFLLFAILGCGAARAQTLVHAYYFNGTLNDSVGSTALTNPYGGSLTSNPGYYTFGTAQGLGFTGASGLQTDFTIAMRFSFDTLGGYQRIIDFSNLGSDIGMYTLGTALRFYPVTSGGTLTANTGIDFILTRSSSSGLVTGYFGTTEVFNFTDTSNYAVGSTIPGQTTWWFFRDDGGENAPGRVDSLLIYNGALSGAAIAAGAATNALTAIPEPATNAALLGLAGLAGALWYRRHRLIVRS
jgi:hypothetical protein